MEWSLELIARPDIGDQHMSQKAVRVKELERMAEDSENGSRRNNIHTIGLPERIEGPNRDLVAYLENWLRKERALEVLPTYYALELSHWVPACPPLAGAPPCSVCCKTGLRSVNIQYAMFFPAKLRVTHEEEVQFFNTPSVLCDWINKFSWTRVQAGTPALKSHRISTGKKTARWAEVALSVSGPE
ncbi:hypothetical protein NDU88_003313 [Pleurodeles waltl]|uniref:Uncharacterized protein n=1 Tax=Pleurodeles waltl TaxID=8319 RepID=A0AAV7T636_PLEWA|nr:hypothetical protein NDU88_003313 [Pleurodeles waltl]